MSITNSKNGFPAGLDAPATVQILSSSSAGNAVFVQIPLKTGRPPIGVLFDCGLPFGKLKPVLYDTDYLLITHDHSDHVKKETLRKIIKFFPGIKVYSTYKVARIVDEVVAINTDFLPISLSPDLDMWAVEVPHGDAICFGYFLHARNDPDRGWILYATDLSSTKPLESFCKEHKCKIDLLLLESNYNPERLALFGNHFSGRYNPYLDSSSRHLSRDEHLIFTHKFLKEGGQSYELHKSNRFY